MKGAIVISGLLILAAASRLQGQADSSMLTGSYLGQKPPGMTPEIFAPGLVSREGIQGKLNISPDSSEIIFEERDQVSNKGSFLQISRHDDKWGSPLVLEFSKRYTNMEPCLSPDGMRLYFVSDRPPGDSGEARPAPDIWFVEKEKDGWGIPQNAGEPVSGAGVEVQPFAAKDGHFYFCKSPGEIYCSAINAGKFTAPVRLNDQINSGKVSGPWVAPDNSYIIFHSNREGGAGSWDLYIGFRGADGEWGEAKNMGPEINTAGSEGNATISPDGKYIFFTRDGDIYWISAEIIQKLKP